jgi:HD superfamily phosphodiesterase
MQQVIENAKKYVKELFKKEYSGHDYFHTLRVYQLAKEIAKKEEANVQITELVALLHDVDDIKLSPTTHKNKDNARKFLIENNIDYKEIEDNTNMMRKDGLILVCEPFFLDDELREKAIRWVEWANNADPKEYDPFA